MKILYFGGQKSGKSSLAEKHTKEIASKKPYYIATYLDNYGDKEMKKRLDRHKAQRGDDFITIEEGFDLASVIDEGETYIVDCLSMWILNNLEEEEETLLEKVDKFMQKDVNIVFIINDVGSGVIPMDKVSRKFVDFTGIIGQRIASSCDEVYQVNFGIKRRIK